MPVSSRRGRTALESPADRDLVTWFDDHAPDRMRASFTRADFALADYVKIPSALALLLTLAQTTQMAAGMAFITIALNHARQGNDCAFTSSAAGISAFIYLSCPRRSIKRTRGRTRRDSRPTCARSATRTDFTLFARFAINAYGRKPKKGPPKSPPRVQVDSGLRAAYAQDSTQD